jgi:hypothetical protein
MWNTKIILENKLHGNLGNLAPTICFSHCRITGVWLSSLYIFSEPSTGWFTHGPQNPSTFPGNISNFLQYNNPKIKSIYDGQTTYKIMYVNSYFCHDVLGQAMWERSSYPMFRRLINPLMEAKAVSTMDTNSILHVRSPESISLNSIAKKFSNTP